MLSTGDYFREARDAGYRGQLLGTASCLYCTRTGGETMKLAQLIYLAPNNSEVRLALESGTLQAADTQALELAAASEIMRYSRHTTGNSGSSLFGGHERGNGLPNL